MVYDALQSAVDASAQFYVGMLSGIGYRKKSKFFPLRIDPPPPPWEQGPRL